MAKIPADMKETTTNHISGTVLTKDLQTTEISPEEDSNFDDVEAYLKDKSIEKALELCKFVLLDYFC